MMHFYVLTLATLNPSYAEFELVNKPERVEPPKCDACGARLSNLRELPPHRYRLKYGTTPGDLLSDGMELAVSSRFVDSFRDSNLTGLEFSDAPIELAGSELEYYIATPKCTYTLLDETASGVVFDELVGCDKCRVIAIEKIDRIVIREETWMGEDVFMMGNLFGRIVLSKRFVDFVRSNEFTNFEFIDQQDYHVDYGFN